MKINWNTPVKLTFGPGSLGEIGEIAQRYGKKAMIVTTGTYFQETGLVDRVKGLLAERGVDTVTFTEISPNPTCVDVDRAAALAMDTGCDVLIGLGGGSAIDAAKGIAIAAGHRAKIWSFAPTPTGGQEVITDKTLPIVAVTTTSGTGSHVTQYVVLTNPETKEKPGFGCDYTWAKHAVIDPELMISLPPRITASTGFDVFCHALEAYTSRMSTPMSDIYAQQAIVLVGKYLRKAVHNGGNIEAREQMALADTLAGVAISMGGVTNCHAVAHAAGGLDNVVHGEFLAALAPTLYEFCMRANPEKYKRIGSLLNSGLKTQGQPDEVLLVGTVREMKGLLKDIGLDVTLKDIGVGTDVRKIAEATVAYMGVGLDNDYQRLTADDITALMEQAYG